MTLSFSTQIDGKPTYFLNKIWLGLSSQKLVSNDLRSDFIAKDPLNYMADAIYPIKRPKIHTIREDKKDRWKPGNKIHFVINNRTKNRFQFAPVIPVKSIQEIEIKYFLFDGNSVNNPFLYKTSPLDCVRIKIDGKMLDTEEMKTLAENDGFVNLYGFFKWFNSDFKGKIIHWTSFSYCG